MENLSEQPTHIMSYKEWAINIFLSSLPVVGLILLLVWAFDSNTPITKKNWAKGMLLLAVIGFLIAMLFLFVFGGMALFMGMRN